MKKHLLITLLALLSYSGIAQVTFEKAINTLQGYPNEYGLSLVQQTTDDGYILAGGYGNSKLIKTDVNGDTLWIKDYGITSDTIIASSIKQTSDGGYFLTGTTNHSNNAPVDIYLLKTDSVGIVQWSKFIGGSANSGACYGEQTNDGGFIITGYTNSYGAGGDDIYLIKTNSNGDTTWTKTYGGTGNEGGNDIQQTTDGGYIITGGNSYGTLLLKTNSVGSPLWSKVLVESDSAGNGTSIQQSTDGGYIIMGSSYPNLNPASITLIKTDTVGNVSWAKKFAGLNAEDGDFGFAVKQTTDGGYIIGDNANLSFVSADDNVCLIKTNSIGDTLWGKIYWGILNEGANNFLQTSDDGYVIAGREDLYANSSQNFIKTDVNGNTGCNVNVSSFPVSTDTLHLQVYNYPLSISSGGIVTTPVTIVGRPGGTDTTFCTSSTAGIAKIPNDETISLYPNPTTSSFTISTKGSKIKEVKVFDVVGKEIRNYELGIRNDVIIDMKGVSKGIYFVQIQTDKGMVNRKVVIE